MRAILRAFFSSDLAFLAMITYRPSFIAQRLTHIEPSGVGGIQVF
jgi:hypothetical protein